MSRESNENGFVEGFPISAEGTTAETYLTYHTLQPAMNNPELIWAQQSPQNISILTLDGPMNQTASSVVNSVAGSIQETPLAHVTNTLEMDNLTLGNFLGIQCENSKLGDDNPSFAGLPTGGDSVRSCIIDEDSDSLHEPNIGELSVLMHDTNIQNLSNGALSLSPENVVTFVEAPPLALGETETRGRRRSGAASGRLRQARSSSTSSVSSTSSLSANSSVPSPQNSSTPKQRRRPRVPKVYDRTEPFADPELEKKRLNAISAKKNRELKKEQSATMKKKLENAMREKDELQRELREMKLREEALRTELEKKGVTFPCL